MAVSPYRPGLRYDHGTMREYISFSWPLMLAVAGGFAIAQLSLLFGDIAIGLAGAGAIGLAATFAAYTERVDGVITQTLYPAICRVRDRGELMLEVFVKSNRLALMWAVPFGVALCLFAEDLVEFGIGEQWRDAVILLQVFGLTAAFGHVGFNWVAFYRALGNTRPEAVVTAVTLLTFLVVTVPLLFAYGLDGFAAGTAVLALAALAGRWYYITKLFPDLNFFTYLVRAFAPTLPGVIVVLGARLAIDSERGLDVALIELAAFVLITGVTTVLLERRLIGEAFSYLRQTGGGGREPAAEPAVGGT
jgi:O-antigen/teichoic acid export membrane protein